MTKLYDLLSTKVGKETTENLTSYIEDKIKDDFQDNLKILATREDLANLKGELKTDIASSKTEVIKWMFIFWIGQLAATFGFILLFLKK
jgi:ribosomal protein S17E